MIDTTALYSEKELCNAAINLASQAKAGDVIYLIGDLGAGKTTFSRAFIQSLGHSGLVTSPTYALVNQYSAPQFTINHFDFYRLADPDEAHYIGLDDYFNGNSVCLVEWPDMAQGVIPHATVIVQIDMPEAPVHADQRNMLISHVGQ